MSVTLALVGDGVGESGSLWRPSMPCDRPGTGAGGGEAAPLALSPSLSKCHNSNREENSQLAPEKRVLSGSSAKTAFAVRINCAGMGEEYGIACLGFLTLTVGDYWCWVHGLQIPKKTTKKTGIGLCPCCRQKMQFKQVFDAAEASKRLNSLRVRVLNALFEKAVFISERHASGAIHFHALGVIKGRPDIRTGYDDRAVRWFQNYSSVSKELLKIWAMLREKLPMYGFGRNNLEPVRKTGDAVASYVSKYIEKTIQNRQPQDKHKRLVRYHGFNKQQLKPNEFEWDGTAARGLRARLPCKPGSISTPHFTRNRSLKLAVSSCCGKRLQATVVSRDAI